MNGDLIFAIERGELDASRAALLLIILVFLMALWQVILLYRILGKENTMAVDLTSLQNAVAKETDATKAGVVLIQGLADELKKTAGDQAAVNALADQVSAQAQSLADAVTANTPAAPPA